MRWTPEQLRNYELKHTGQTWPHKVTKAAEREADLHDDILTLCRGKGWIVFHGSMAHQTRRTVGEPDFVLCLPNGITLFVEAKSATGKLSKEQQALRSWMTKLGHTVHIVRSIEEFNAVTKGIPAV